MPVRVKFLIVLMLVSAACSLRLVSGPPSHDWVRFAVYFVVVVLTAGLKVAMPKGDGTMSVNFPFILLGILQLSPLQAVALAAVSVVAQCRIRVMKSFTLVQIAFNLGNVVVATVLACLAFEASTLVRVEMAPALALAATVYFFANTIPVALVIAWTNGESAFSLWRREFPWYLPFYLVGAFLAAIVQFISIRLGWVTSLLIVPLVYTIHRAYRAQVAAIDARQKHLEESEALHLRTIEGLAMAIEAKDQGTHDHLLRVRVYVSEIGKMLGLDTLQMKALLTAALLHDIGKLAVPEHIINKPGKLTPEEFDKMKIHPVVGADILGRVRFPYPVTPIVRSHHEAWDGSGYPDGLKGEEIPIGARILTVVDCFDAMASDRPYRLALQLEDAMAYVKSRAGSQFDPVVVAILEGYYIELERLARQDGSSLAALQTEVSVTRGAAPAAGFEQENTQIPPIAGISAASDGDTKAQSVPDRSPVTCDSLNLITAASREAQAFFEMSGSLEKSIRSDETASVMSFSLSQWIAFDCFAIYLKQENALRLHYMDGSGKSFFSSAPIPAGEGLSGWVLENGKPIINGNPEVEPNYAANSSSQLRLRSALSLPLREPNDEIFGVLTLYSAPPDSFSTEHLRILLTMESKLSLSLKNALMFQNPDEDAGVDFVTQLPNLRQFSSLMEAELKTARELQRPLGVVVCDLNSFKAVNDKLGHAMGNKLLRAIADGFRKHCRQEDIVARIGGDVFVFLLPGANRRSFEPRLWSLQQSVRESCASLRVDVSLSTSVGAAFYPEDCGSAETLLDLADRRMVLHKRTSSHRGPVSIAASASNLQEAS